jgi:lyso-ornithine lipid O-acyltransferase
MSLLGIGVRVAILVALFATLAPLVALGGRRGWPLAGTVPVLFHRAVLRLFGVRLTVRGSAPGATPTLVLSNHVSWLDIPVIGSLRPISFVAKAEIAAWPVFGLCASLQRSVFIDRARRAATAEANAAVAHRLAAGEAMVLFAEGTTGDGNRLLPFRSSLVGAARAALADPTVERIHLQPLALAYTRRNGMPVTRRERPAIAWYGDMDLLPHLHALLRGGPIDVVVTWGEPIPFDASTDRKRATALAEAAVRAALGATAQGAPASAPIRPPAAEPAGSTAEPAVARAVAIAPQAAYIRRCTVADRPFLAERLD